MALRSSIGAIGDHFKLIAKPLHRSPGHEYRPFQGMVVFVKRPSDRR
jgi:hypothetical protein